MNDIHDKEDYLQSAQQKYREINAIRNEEIALLIQSDMIIHDEFEKKVFDHSLLGYITLVEFIAYFMKYLQERAANDQQISLSDAIHALSKKIIQTAGDPISFDLFERSVIYNATFSGSEKKFVSYDALISKGFEFRALTQNESSTDAGLVEDDLVKGLAEKMAPSVRKRFWALWKIIKKIPSDSLCKMFTSRNSFGAKILVEHGIVENNSQAQYTMTKIRQAALDYFKGCGIKITPDNRGGVR